MPGLHRRPPRLGALLLALVLLGTLSLSGHHHRADEATAKQSCAVCMVTNGCPVVHSVAPAAVQAPPAAGLVVAGTPAFAPVSQYRSAKAGRAPPAARAPRPA